MSEFKVTLARIEAVNEGEQGKQIRAVFHIERDLIGFNVPICNCSALRGGSRFGFDKRAFR